MLPRILWLVVVTACALVRNACGQGANFTTVTVENGSTLKQSTTSTNFLLAATFLPCTGFQVHTHPRGYEVIQVSSGELVGGYVNEANKFIPVKVTTSTTAVIPQGLIHYVLNSGCKPAIATFVFPLNPGAQFIFAAQDAIPADLASGYFINGKLPTPKGKVFTARDPECLKRCKLPAQG
eukprot:jgi/Chrzof1/3457/Cz12g26090.t1